MSQDGILDPTASVETSDKNVSLAARFGTLDGQTVALYSNNKQNSDHFLRALAESLTKRYPELEVGDVTYKPQAANPGSRWGIVDEIARNADVALVAYGDCGACTSYTVYDALELESRGVPTASFSSTKFIDLGRFEALHHNCPGLPIIEFEHPIASLPAEDVGPERVTESVVEETDFALTAPAADVAESFSNRYSAEDFDGRPQFDNCTI
jgi:hypothetical protein